MAGLSVYDVGRTMARMPARVQWSPEELLVAFRLYCRTPFGRLHRRNPAIVELSEKLGRTPSAVAMKACNFASLDPAQRARDIKALANVSQADRRLWARFQRNPEEVASEAETAYAEVTGRDAPPLETELEAPEGPSEISRMVRTRRVQGFFRDAVLISYDNRCALSEIAIPDLFLPIGAFCAAGNASSKSSAASRKPSSFQRSGQDSAISASSSRAPRPSCSDARPAPAVPSSFMPACCS